MMKIWLISILLLFSASAIAKPVPKTSIPAAFHGDWALEGSICVPGPADSGNMRITKRTIDTFESSGVVTHVEKFDSRTIRVDTRITHNAGTFGNSSMMTVSTDNMRLTIGEMSDMSLYKRCGK
jgi:hypothetical protein